MACIVFVISMTGTRQKDFAQEKLDGSIRRPGQTSDESSEQRDPVRVRMDPPVLSASSSEQPPPAASGYQKEVLGENPETQHIEEGNLLNGKREGEWLSLFPGGAIWSRCTYKDDLLEGHARYWDDQGRLQTDTEYKGGKPDGLAIGWHTNGSKAFEINWSNGVEEGPWTLWYESGQLRGEGNRKAGKLDGTCTYYLPDGSIDSHSSGIFSMGKKTSDLP